MKTFEQQAEELRDFVHSLKIGKEKENPIIKAILELERMYAKDKKEYASQAIDICVEKLNQTKSEYKGNTEWEEWI